MAGVRKVSKRVHCCQQARSMASTSEPQPVQQQEGLAVEYAGVPDLVTLPPELHVSIQGNNGPMYKIIDPPHATVGRNAKTSTMHIKDASVSEKHAHITWNGTHWQIRDVGSSNGTIHNGTKLSSYVHAAKLQEGDSLQFGDVVCSVKCVPRTAADCTVTQLLESQLEAMVQNLLAHHAKAIQYMKQEWAAAREQLLQSTAE